MPPKKKKKKSYIDPVTRANNARVIREMEAAEKQEPQSKWEPRGSQPPNVGVVEATGHVASFKTGGRSGEDTLISDGDYSDDRKGFDKNHDHHGPWGSDTRGHYSGPDH